MGIKISERIKKHILEWDEVRNDLILKEYELGSWNSTAGEYDMTLSTTKKVGGADYINIYDYTSLSTTTISVTNTFYKLNCSVSSPSSKGFTFLSNGRITKSGNGYGWFKLEGNISCTGGNNQELMFSFFKNGVRLNDSEGDVITSSGGKGNTAPIQCLTQLNDGDYIEVYVKNSTSTTNVDLKHMNVIITEIC